MNAGRLYRFGTHKQLIMWVMVGLLLFCEVGILGWEAKGDSATWDEVGHFAAGIDHWRGGTFDLYCVNPPLVRVWATALEAWRGDAPVLDKNYPTSGIPGGRAEFALGSMTAAGLGYSYFTRLAYARWMCIPFAMLGAVICFRWAGELWGRWAGLTALVLWCFSPSVLAYGHLIVPDVAATSFGLLAVFSFRRWLRTGGWSAAFLSGCALGVAELTKMTLLLFFVLWPFLWAVWRLAELVHSNWRKTARDIVQLALQLLLAVFIMNLAYGFQGSLTPLESFSFISPTLNGQHSDGKGDVRSRRVGNRFHGAWFGRLPVPLPLDYVRGLDLQKADFDVRYWSFLNGEWRLGGWWYYYAYAIVVKEPLGTWITAFIAVVLFGRCRSYRAPWREEILLAVPAISLGVFVSSQTGFNHHVRYVLPVLPFVLVSCSRVGLAIVRGDKWWAAAAYLNIIYSVASSLFVVPHSLSYFNELAGGPAGGHNHLGSSNADWGQDLLYLKQWIDLHPSARPLNLAYDLPLIDPSLAGIEYIPAGIGTNGSRPLDSSHQLIELVPGWYAVSVNELHSREHDFDYLLKLRPVAMVGYTIYIYNLSLEDAQRIRSERGLLQPLNSK